MLTGKSPVSHIHRLKSDELWSFNLGKPIIVIEITPKNKLIKTVLGNDPEELIKGNQNVSYLVKGGSWFGSYIQDGAEENDYSLVTCTVVPGFKFEEFELLAKGDEKSKGVKIPKKYQFMVYDKKQSKKL